MKLCRILFLALMVAVICAVSAHADDGLFSLPADTIVIEQEAFAGVTGIQTLLLPEGVERIESRAFSECEIDGVTLPRSLVYIADDAFKLIRHATVVEDSYAHTWCVENQIEVTLLEKETPAEYFTHTPIDDTHTCITGYTGDLPMW